MAEPNNWPEEEEELRSGRSRKAQTGLQIGATLALLALLVPPLLLALSLLKQETQPPKPELPISPGALS